jgi:response regulator RpfG family c-di-GMP phosphodiesterase
MDKTILMVDDEPNILTAFKRQLRGDFEIETTHKPEIAVAYLKEGRKFSVIVADMHMPEMDGIAFLKEAEKLAPDSVRMMLTGNADQRTAVHAINEGHIFRFLNKPCTTATLTNALNAGLRQHELIRAEKELLSRTLNGGIKLLLDVIAILDPALMGETSSLRKPLQDLAKELGVPNLWATELALMLSAIGSVLLPPALNVKIQAKLPLTEKEAEIIADNPRKCRELIEHIPRLKAVAEIVFYSDQLYDGGGYPGDGVSGNDIPLGSRLIKTLKDYRSAEELSGDPVMAYEAMCQQKGVYDPQVLDALGVYYKLTPELLQEAEAESTKVAKSPASLEKTVMELRTGDLLSSDVSTSDGVLLVPAGREVTQALLGRICNYHSLVGVKEPIVVSLEPLEREET